MSLSPRDQRILSGIEHELTAAEPRLARALATTRLPVLRRRPLVPAGRRHRGAGAWIAAIAMCLLAGIAMLSIGLALDIIALACAGAVMAWFGPVALGYLCGRLRRARLRGAAQLRRPCT